MKIFKTFQYRLRPTDDQNEILHRHGGNTRFVWNQLLEFSNDITELVIINKFSLQEKLVKLKNENEFLKETYSQPLQIQADRLDKTFKKSRSAEVRDQRRKKIYIASKIKEPEKKAKKLKKAESFGFPHFKSRHRQEDSIFYPQNFKIRKTRMYFPKIGWISYIHHRHFEGKPKNVTIKQDGKFWNCSVMCEIEILDVKPVPLEQAKLVGIDMGIKTFATFSDGSVVENPKFLKKFEKRIKIEQKKLSRKLLKVGKNPKGKEIKVSSNNRLKQLEKLQNQYRRLRNSRRNFIFQIVCRMIIKYDGFCVETLDIQNMIREAQKEHKKFMTRSIYDVSWFEFLRVLGYKCLWFGKYFQKIAQFFASTQTCPFCGHVQKEITLDDRVLTCPLCGRVMERDSRSSLAILNEGLRLLRGIPKEPGELKTVGENVENIFDESVTSSVASKRNENALAFSLS